MIGNTTGRRPSRALSSVWQTPTASTRTRISSSRGSSRSSSSIDSGARASQATAAWIFTRSPCGRASGDGQDHAAVRDGHGLDLDLAERAGWGADPGPLIADPRHLVAHPLADLHRLEQPLAAGLGADVVPVTEADHEVRPVVQVVLQYRVERLDVHLLLIDRRHDEVVGQVLAADEPAGLGVPQVLEQLADVRAVEDALR